VAFLGAKRIANRVLAPLDHDFERPRLSSLSASAMTTSFINSSAEAYRAVQLPLRCRARTAVRRSLYTRRPDGERERSSGHRLVLLDLRRR
jgi:hypothetical protein